MNDESLAAQVQFDNAVGASPWLQKTLQGSGSNINGQRVVDPGCKGQRVPKGPWLRV